MSEGRTEPDVDGTWDRFLDRVSTVRNLRKAEYILLWDQEVVMPDEGKEARSQQIGTISSVIHDLVTDDEAGEMIAELDGADLTYRQQRIVQKFEERRQGWVNVPKDVIEEFMSMKSKGHREWLQAREEDDFSQFVPSFERLVELNREESNHIDPDADPYVLQYDEYDPDTGLGDVERIMGRVRDTLDPLIEGIHDSDAELQKNVFTDTYDPDVQQELCGDMLEMIGWNWDRCRLDPAPYPLTSGYQYDSRIAGPFDEDDLLQSIMWVLHEAGPAKYQLALKDDEYGYPTGDANDVLHHAMARFWQNQIGRSEEFWERFMPRVHERFPRTKHVTARDAYEAVNYVHEDSLVRTQSDELTRELHVVLRWEIERELISGDMDVEDVPEVWTDKCEEYLGARPETNAEGCLQDVHWANGAFGYFPVYLLGSVIAAQLHEAAADDVGAPRKLASQGDFDAINEWLDENVLKHGKLYPMPELVERVSGEEPTADYYLDYVTGKYGDLYDLDGV